MIRFRLEPLRKYRKLQEDILERALAETRRQLDGAKGKLADCRHSYGEAARQFQQKQARGKLSAAAAEVHSVYLAQLEDVMRRQKKDIENIRQQIRQKRGQLLDAVKNRKMLDKLKEKQQQRVIEAMHRSERHFFDDVATNTFIRKSSPNE